MNREDLEKMTKENIINEYISLLNYNVKVETENNKHFTEMRDLSQRFNELEKNYNTLMKYVKHIQDYLCKDIFELMKENEEDYYD